MMEEAAIMKYAVKMEDPRKLYECIVYLNFFVRKISWQIR